MTDNPFIVSTEWLQARLDDPNVSIVDGSWYLPTMLADGEPRSGRKEYEAQHIPGAVFFDIDTITEPGSTLPHTLASPNVFSKKVGDLGISNQDTIIVYDGMGLFSAPRVWWNFRVMGAANVFILDGGLPAWLEAGLPVESGNTTIQKKSFSAIFDSASVISFDEMRKLVADETSQIADARPAPRFTGAQPEPREGMRSGHMPGATSVPFSNLAENGKLLPSDKLKTMFDESGIDLTRPVVTSCGFWRNRCRTHARARNRGASGQEII